MRAHRAAEQDDRVGDDVGKHHIRLHVQALQQIPLAHLHHAFQAVSRDVFARHAHRHRVDVHAQGMGCAQPGGRQRQDARAGAHIQHRIARPQTAFQQFQAHIGGFMRSVAKGHARVDFDDSVVRPGGKGLPDRLDDQAPACPEGLVVPLPVFRPVLFAHVFYRERPRAGVKANRVRRQRLQRCPQRRHALQGRSVLRQIGVHEDVLVHGFDQSGVYHIPLGGVFQLCLRVHPVFYQRAGRARAHQRLADHVRACRVGAHGHFQPVHAPSLPAYQFRPSLNRSRMRSKNDLRVSYSFPVRESSNCLSSSFCRSLRRRGTSTRTRTNRSPRPEERSI